MLIKLWNFLRGYVIIYINGFSSNRVIDVGISKGIIYEQVEPFKTGYLISLALKDFRKMYKLARSYRCKVRIHKRVGLPFILWRYRKRKFWLFGVLLAFIGIYLLSSFIWLVEINGTNRLNPSEITAFLAENGVNVGSVNRNIDYREVERLMMARFSDIAWVSLSINGTVARVDISESIIAPLIVDLNTPANIIARADGIIEYIATSQGQPQVRVGDIVLAGQLLVSGQVATEVIYEEPIYQYVHSISEIWARMYYTMEFHVPFIYFEKEFTGNVRNVYTLLFNDNPLEIPHFKISFENYEIIEHNNQLSFGRNYPMPLHINRKEYKEYITVIRERNIDQATYFGQSIVDARILEDFGLDTHIYTQEITFEKLENGVNVRAFVITIERIGVLQPIEVEY